MLRSWYILGLTLITGAQIALGSVDSPTARSAAAAPAVTLLKKEPWHATATPTHRKVEKGVPNFGKLNDFIWRSGQPTGEGYKALAMQGLKTVVNLREEYPQDKDIVPEGVKYVYIPITDQQAPTPEQAKQFLEVASNSDNWPLLVHCHGGEGRAGVMSALVRRSLDGWDCDKTMKETGNFRIRHLGLFTTQMPACQQRFIREWSQTAPAPAKP